MLLEDICNVINDDAVKLTARKMSKYGVFSGLYFPVFGMISEIYTLISLQSEYEKVWNRKDLEFGHFSQNETEKWRTVTRLLLNSQFNVLRTHVL